MGIGEEKEEKGKRRRNLRKGEEEPTLFGHDLLAYGLRLRLSALSVKR